MSILFYSTREQPYGCFSNFSAHGFELDNAWWPTSEHYSERARKPRVFKPGMNGSSFRWRDGNREKGVDRVRCVCYNNQHGREIYS